MYVSACVCVRVYVCVCVCVYVCVRMCVLCVHIHEHLFYVCTRIKMRECGVGKKNGDIFG